jgi:hypothetical protein
MGIGPFMKIAIFGCSWTHGVGQIEKYINWPYFFAQKYPNAEITNYAIAASSVSFQIHQMNIVKKTTPADLYIFQISRPERLTYWEPKTDFFNYLEPAAPNLKQYYHGIFQSVQCLTAPLAGQMPNMNNKQKSIDFAKQYYRNVNVETMDLEWELSLDYIKRNTDFCFLQTEGAYRNVTDIPCVEDILTREKCREWWEAGTHFGRTGLQWVADYVDENVKEIINAKM